MTVWYGESYQLDWGTVLAGPSFDLTAWRKHFDAATHAVSAGDDVVIGGYADPNDYSAFVAYDQPVVARWVLEVVGGSGTVSLSAGLDPSFGYDDPGLATQDLGSFTVAGPTQIVSPPLAVDHALLAAQDTGIIVRIEGVSGSVDVAQVKLRVWPAGGAGGAWVTGADWTRTDGNVNRWYGSMVGGTPQLPTYEDAWNALKDVTATWDGAAGTEYSNTTDGASARSYFDVFDNIGTAPFTPSGSAGGTVVVVQPQLQAPLPEPSIVYGTDPNEVRREARSFIRATGGGDAVTQFVGWDAAATFTVTNTHVASDDLGDTFDLGPHPTNPAWRLGPLHHPSAFVLRDGAIQLSEFGGPNLAISVMADGYYTGPPTADAYSSTGGSLSSSLPYLVRIANYEWFDPAAVAVQPRFYVKHRDDTMRPVGFGKPATELTVLRVPGGGRWRDLTTDEYATYGPTARPPGGMALKVKRLDAGGSVWWDQVGWMVPDA